jgi:hypothetical protein
MGFICHKPWRNGTKGMKKRIWRSQLCRNRWLSVKFQFVTIISISIFSFTDHWPLITGHQSPITSSSVFPKHSLPIPARLLSPRLWLIARLTLKHSRPNGSNHPDSCTYLPNLIPHPERNAVKLSSWREPRNTNVKWCIVWSFRAESEIREICGAIWSSQPLRRLCFKVSLAIDQSRGREKDGQEPETNVSWKRTTRWLKWIDIASTMIGFHIIRIDRRQAKCRGNSENLNRIGSVSKE